MVIIEIAVRGVGWTPPIGRNCLTYGAQWIESVVFPQFYVPYEGNTGV